MKTEIQKVIELLMSHADGDFVSKAEALEAGTNLRNINQSSVWEWYNNVDKTGWEAITPSVMDAIIAHGLNPQPQFRHIIVLS